MENQEKNCSSLKQIVYEKLKQKIVSCEFLPGSQLSEEAICGMLEASRTPVRDAISRLEMDQLVTIHPKKGIYVNHVSLANVSELFEARLRIEPYAVEYYGNRIHTDVYASWLAYFESERAENVYRYDKDDEFHRLFIDATENRYLIRFYSTIRDQSMRCRILSAGNDRLADSNREHLNIVHQCLRGNWAAAAKEVRNHIEDSKISIVRYVQQQNLDAKNIFVPASCNEE